MIQVQPILVIWEHVKNAEPMEDSTLAWSALISGEIRAMKLITCTKCIKKLGHGKINEPVWCHECIVELCNG